MPVVAHIRDRRPAEKAQIIDAIIRDVAELPDRTSPEGQPDMMLVTANELRHVL